MTKHEAETTPLIELIDILIDNEVEGYEHLVIEEVDSRDYDRFDVIQDMISADLFEEDE